MSRCSFALTLAAVLGCSAAYAAPPWTSLLPFKKVEADPKSSYTLTKSNGPWMIMAMSFSGEEAEAQARKLVLELRRDHKVEAWMHEQSVELDEQVYGLGVNPRGGRKKMKYYSGSAGASEIAVLVGNFKSFDDPDAARVLETIRYVTPKSLTGALAQKGDLRIRDKYNLASQWLAGKEKPKVRGPLGRAFITRNPMLPADEVAKQSLDPFVAELNEGIEHSLLTNPGQYTVAVGTFRGAAAYSEKNFNETVRKSIARSGDAQIDKAAIDATLVTAELRKQGVEAYVFHDRHESLVTVGSFNDVGQEAADGHIELRPDIAAVIKRFEAQKASLDGARGTGANLAAIPTGQVGLVPKTVLVVYDKKKYQVPLDVSPRLIMVPRKSIADVYRREASLR